MSIHIQVSCISDFLYKSVKNTHFYEFLTLPQNKSDKKIMLCTMQTTQQLDKLLTKMSKDQVRGPSNFFSKPKKLPGAKYKTLQMVKLYEKKKKNSPKEKQKMVLVPVSRFV